jgi:lysophospholipase
MFARFWFAAMLTLGLCSATGAAEQPYDGSGVSSFLKYLADRGLSDWALPEWSSGAVIDFFRAPDGVQLCYAHWSAAVAKPTLGTVVHFNGRTEFIERNILTYRDLAARGWHVWTLDWRGQGLSSRQVDGRNAQHGHIDSFETYVSDAEQFLERVVKPKTVKGRPKILLGHSMGGQIALRYMLKHKDDFGMVVLSSPLVRLPGGKTSEAIQNIKPTLDEIFPFIGNNCVLTKSGSWQGSFRGSSCSALGDLTSAQLRDSKVTQGYTHDKKNLAASECLVELSRRGGRNPGLAVACPTGGWLVAADNSTTEVFEESEMLTKPVLIVAAKDDAAVDPEAQRQLCQALERCSLVQVPYAGHELLIEKPEIRAAFLGCFDAFVADPDSGLATCERIIKDIEPE